VVVVIITILVVGIVSVGRVVKTNAQIKVTKNTLSLVNNALQEYFNKRKGFPRHSGTVEEINAYLYAWLNELPASQAILSELPEKATELREGAVVTIGGRDFARIVLVDSWTKGSSQQRRELKYINQNDGNFPLLISAGPDGVFDTADDIVSSEI